MPVQLLEGIGAMSKVDGQKAKSHSSNYQDITIAPVDHKFDNEAVQKEDEEEYEDSDLNDGIIIAVTKVMFSLSSWFEVILIDFSYEKSFKVFVPAHSAAKIGSRKST